MPEYHTAMVTLLVTLVMSRGASSLKYIKNLRVIQLN
jgi:hypothetical protein